jgi:uncharacterized protein YndB with AHSA1/START domain
LPLPLPSVLRSLTQPYAVGECYSYAMSTNTEQALVVELQRQIAASPEHVWQFAAEGIKEWLGPQIFEPEIGGRMLIDVLMGAERWIMYGNVTAWDAPRELAFTWNEVDVRKRIVPVADTLLTIMLEPRDGGTLVTLRHSGFEALPDAEVQYRNYKEGWESLNDLEKLAEMCEAQ